jgi:hypothetical protein
MLQGKHVLQPEAGLSSFSSSLIHSQEKASVIEKWI